VKRSVARRGNDDGTGRDKLYGKSRTGRHFIILHPVIVLCFLACRTPHFIRGYQRVTPAAFYVYTGLCTTPTGVSLYRCAVAGQLLRSFSFDFRLLHPIPRTAPCRRHVRYRVIKGGRKTRPFICAPCMIIHLGVQIRWGAAAGRKQVTNRGIAPSFFHITLKK
jgi:hypothetical protein